MDRSGLLSAVSDTARESDLPTHSEVNMHSIERSPNIKRTDSKIPFFNSVGGVVIFILCLVIVFVCGILIGLLAIDKTAENVKPDNIVKRQIDYNATLSSLLQENVDPYFMLQQLKLLTSKCHPTGSPTNTYLAGILKENWQNWGWKNVHLDNYTTAVSEPDPDNPNIVQLLYTNGTVAKTFATTELNGSLPVYHAFSPNGSAEADFVYANYGRTKDYKTLTDNNVEVCDGVIVIVRLGRGSRGGKGKRLAKYCESIKKKLPAGLLIYPDPANFALNRSEVFPNGWWLPSDAPVFGHVIMKGVGGGDLATPELPAIDTIYREDYSDRISPFPIQPISWADAQDLLNMLEGPPVPSSWKSLGKKLGPSKNYVIRLTTHNRIIQRKITNVVAILPGVEEPDRYVILGNHRDAWTFGASDPISGTIIFQQVFKILGEAYTKSIFRPRRTIVAVSWDGEEMSLQGSTEFTERLKKELSDRAVAYINADCPIKGSWGFRGRVDPLLAEAMRQSSKSVILNKSGRTLYDDWSSKSPLVPGKPELGPRVSNLGGGSDHIAFNYKLGIPAAYPEWRYNESLPSMPTYHTIYDSSEMMLRFIDPQLVHHNIVTRFVLDYALRLTDSTIIPYSLADLEHFMTINFVDLNQTAMGCSFFKSGEVSLDGVHSAINTLVNSMQNFDRMTSYLNSTTESSKLRIINNLLLQLPRSFLWDEGLPSRSYYKNVMVTTSMTNSYGSSAFTGVRDALYLSCNSDDPTLVKRQISILITCLNYANQVMRGGLIGFHFI